MNQPWGMKICGGRDFRVPLQIKKVSVRICKNQFRCYFIDEHIPTVLLTAVRFNSYLINNILACKNFSHQNIAHKSKT